MTPSRSIAVFAVTLAACASHKSAPDATAAAAAKKTAPAPAAAPALAAAPAAAVANNPFFEASPLPLEYPPFDRIHDADYAPGFEAGMAAHLKEI